MREHHPSPVAVGRNVPCAAATWSTVASALGVAGLGGAGSAGAMKPVLDEQRALLPEAVLPGAGVASVDHALTRTGQARGAVGLGFAPDDKGGEGGMVGRTGSAVAHRGHAA